MNLLERLHGSALAGLCAALLLAGAANASPGAGNDMATPGAKATQVSRDEVFSRIQPGLRASQVLELIGPPLRKMRFERTKTTAWDYSYRDSWGYDAEFSVIVDDAGIVVGKFASRPSPG